MGLDMATGKKMSEYTPFSELSSEEKATYMGNAAVTTFGAKVSEGDNINVNIPLSTLVPSATDLAGDGLSVNGSTGKLDVSNKVPAPTATTDRGKVRTVNNSDEVVWDTPSGGGGGLTPITVNGVYTDSLYTVTIPSNNTFVTVPNITQEVNNLVVKIVPPAISSGEFLNVVVELVPMCGWDKKVIADGGLHKLGREGYSPSLIEGYLYAQVILRGNCYEVLIEDDDE